MSLVYLSPVVWAGYEHRPHKFVRWFHDRTGRPVLWINPYPTRLPRISDFASFSHRKVDAPISSTLLPGAVPDWLIQLSVPAIPVEPLPVLRSFNLLLWVNAMRRVEQFCANAGDVILGIGKPSVLSFRLIQRKDLFSRTLYDAMDDMPAFYTGISRSALEYCEGRIVRSVDTILASSTKLRDKWLADANSVSFVRNGLDDALIQSSFRSRVPTRLAGQGLVFGYVGTISHWFDWNWVRQLALSDSTHEVRIIGPVHGSLPSMPSNVLFFPACSQAEALARMQDFDIGVIPFLSNRLTESVDPIKYYEYRAVGLPVLSTPFGEMTAHIEDIGLKILDAAELMQFDIDFWRTRALWQQGEREKFVNLHSWHSRFDSACIL
jgi:hypothetical protein